MERLVFAAKENPVSRHRRRRHVGEIQVMVSPEDLSFRKINTKKSVVIMAHIGAISGQGRRSGYVTARINLFDLCAGVGGQDMHHASHPPKTTRPLATAHEPLM